MDSFPILKFFNHDHLPERLQLIVRPFYQLAHDMVKIQNGNEPQEVASGLRKLLEAKDCFVRANLT